MTRGCLKYRNSPSPFERHHPRARFGFKFSRIWQFLRFGWANSVALAAACASQDVVIHGGLCKRCDALAIGRGTFAVVKNDM